MPERASHPAAVMASYTFMSFGLPTLPPFQSQLQKTKEKCEGREKKKEERDGEINFKGLNCKHNLVFVNCLETFGGRIKEMKSRTYRNIAV